MSNLKTDERGMALLLAMLAIVVIGAVVSGTFFAGRMEMVSGRNSVYAVQASEAAEAGLAAAFSPWDRNWNNIAVGVDQVLPTVVISGPTRVQYTTTVRRMQGGSYLIRSVGQKLDRSGNVLATRMLAKIGKLVPAGSASVDAAVTTMDAVTVSGNTVVDGHDTVPPGWDPNACGAPNDAAGIQTGSTVSTNGTTHVIDGEPPSVQNDTTLTNATFQGPFNSFLGSRTHTITNSNPPATTPTASGGVCNKSDIYNWGEPRRGGAAVVECEDYFPIVYFGAGTLKLQGGYGQGILLVAGDLWMSGGFEFVGMIIVLGEVRTTGTGAKVTGAVLSNNFYGEQTTLGGDPALRYSSCAIGAALEGTSSGFPITQRPWAQLNPR
ncbi:MAG TPA: hypothetical protein VLB12_15435 [Gemmatimonadales bacterium]|nr:hypothetical protein [Gemmatimonadales bacterium]